MGYYDVIINGGGLAGSALAAALAKHNWNVLLIEPRGAPQRPEPELSLWQSRVYAFAPRPWGWLSHLGVPLPQERAQPVTQMVVRGDRGGVLKFAATDVPLPYLAMIAEAEAVRSAIWQLLQQFSTVTIATESARLVDARWESDAVVVTTAAGESIRGRLLVGAEGRNSWVREIAGITAEVTPYDHHAVVANFACTRDHNGVAYQWFREDGVLAYLPLPGRRLSMVWSTSPQQAEQLMAASPTQLAETVAAAGAEVLGRLSLITEPASFPLSLLRCSRITAQRVMLLGDAAHGIHPLSGHGINLGFNDAATFAELLGERSEASDPGDPLLLVRYARHRFIEPFLLQTVTDALARGFALTNPLVQQVRNVGMCAVDRLPWLKTHLIRYAALAQW